MQHSPLMNAQDVSKSLDDIQVKSNIQQLLNETQSEGVFVIFDGKDYSSYGNALDRAETEFIPASTFKILNALIGLAHGKVTTDEVFKWNGEKRALAIWEKDFTLGQAMAASAVPVYQEVARRIGLTTMQKELSRIGYGNGKVGKQVDRFWLDGPLKITPKQEAYFVYQLAQDHLAFDRSVQKQVKQMLFIEKRGEKKLYAKSGWGNQNDDQVGWYVGWVEQPNGKITAFALNMNMRDGMDVSQRKELTLDILDKLGLYSYLK
ncbi:class D beta-lactamase [Acinetobacter shaoyimingii]|uniref:Beta-lactamase n=1 Tax=Acinetobacter shaoyimingii TaxID=2715164 RepID=A0A6G8RZV5_9GAMM|nr:class D beta-lactamase [Acinetobacter shaoyimingii]